MATYLDMQTRIADEMLNEPITTAQIKLAIQGAINDWSNEQFYFDQKNGTFNTVANQEYYTSTDFADIPNMQRVFVANITINGSKIPIKGVDFADIDAQQPGTVTGPPLAWANYNQQLRMYPIPDAVYAMSFSYLYNLPTLSADADTNAWMNDGEELIRQGAKRRLWYDVLYNAQNGQLCQQLENDAAEIGRAHV